MDVTWSGRCAHATTGFTGRALSGGNRSRPPRLVHGRVCTVDRGPQLGGPTTLPFRYECIRGDGDGIGSSREVYWAVCGRFDRDGGCSSGAVRRLAITAV